MTTIPDLTDPPMSPAHAVRRGTDPLRTVAIVLRCMGALDCCALLAVCLPREWMQSLCVVLTGVAFPAVPVAWYLARSTSLLYALHGAMAVFISFDVPYYWRLIRFLALAAVAHGGLILAIDLSSGMPVWWSGIEGPCFAVTGLIMLGLMRRVPTRALQDAGMPDDP
jgi:hypothetical protein